MADKDLNHLFFGVTLGRRIAPWGYRSARNARFEPTPLYGFGGTCCMSVVRES
jgi:hypothetical protein